VTGQKGAAGGDIASCPAPAFRLQKDTAELLCNLSSPNQYIAQVRPGAYKQRDDRRMPELKIDRPTLKLSSEPGSPLVLLPLSTNTEPKKVLNFSQI
jgi:hypothetical protein